jgi:C1A family cysteine protease
MRKYLQKADLPDSRDKLAGKDLLFSSSAMDLPEMVDLRIRDFPEILNQYWLGACTGYAIIAVAQFMERMRSAINAYHYLQPLFIYRKEREIMGTVDYDSGAYIRDGLKVLKNMGCCTISRYASKEVDGVAVIDVDRYKDKPSAEAEANAAEHKPISAYYRIMQPIQLKQALADGLPVVLGIELWSSFESAEVERTGIVPMPDKTKEYLLGGHAVAAYGYKTINGIEYIICRNSWGKEWGDKGYFYLPMAFLGRYISDMWVVE